MRVFPVVAALLACSLPLSALAKNLSPPKVVVKNIDPKFGFIMINLDEKDTKKGDVYGVTRGGKFVGTIIVCAAKGARAFCRVDKARTIGMNKNPLTGDIRCGDIVAGQKVKPRPKNHKLDNLKANPKNATPNQIKLYY